jgi:hypothetical protein
VFPDIRKANLIFGVCLFCIFVRNTIYAISIDSLQVALLARYLVFKKWARSGFALPI